jgi:ArsR family transcriptional regulator, lead/cadmium/zinc/bismuth-responsive transcriptional repressor
LRCRYDAVVAADRCDLLCLDLPKAERLRAERMDDRSAQRLAERARALADPTRLIIAGALAGSDELCVCDLAWVTGRAENLVSHHLRSLRTAGLAASRREGRMVLYALTPAGRALLDAVRAAAGSPA